MILHLTVIAVFAIHSFIMLRYADIRVMIYFFGIFTYLLSVVNSLVALINDPEPEHPLRADLAEEYTKDRKKFFKNAEEFTKKHSEKRPSD